jgi:arylsulfatase A-like enzyme
MRDRNKQENPKLIKYTAEIKRREFLKYLLSTGVFLTGGETMALLLTSGCSGKEEKNLDIGFDFLDHLEEAEIVPLLEDFENVKRTFFKVNGKGREVLFEYPNSNLTFNDILIRHNDKLVFSIGINEAAWDQEGDGVIFEVIITDDKSQEHTIYSNYIDPKNNIDERKWFDAAIDLNNFAGKKVSFTFKTKSGPGGGSWDHAGWHRPLIVPLKKTQDRKLNVILISIDTLRADHLGCHGYLKDTSPNLDKFTHEGIQFMNAYSPSCWTLPSHMSILTSLYPDVHQVMETETSLAPVWPTLAEIMKKAGYHTAGFVFSCVWMNPEFGFDKGFDIYFVSVDNAENMNKNALSWLNDHKEDNFFLFLHYYDVHSDWDKLPYDSPSPYNQMFLPDYGGSFTGCRADVCGSYYLAELNSKKTVLPLEDRDYIRGMYDGGIKYTDHCIGQLLTQLDQMGLRENTLVIITSDHGEAFQEHNRFLHDQVYNHTMKVPLMMRLPGRISFEKRIEQPVGIIDILPTILDFAEIKTQGSFQGTPLTQVITGKGSSKDTPVYATGKYGQEMIAGDRWKLIYSVPSQAKELYDLKNDPGEKNNVADTEKEQADIMLAQLSKWMEQNEKLRIQAGADSAKKKTKLSEKDLKKLKSLGYIE